jgi:hypothetical protein
MLRRNRGLTGAQSHPLAGPTPVQAPFAPKLSVTHRGYLAHDYEAEDFN